MFWCDDNHTPIDSHNYLEAICEDCKENYGTFEVDGYWHKQTNHPFKSTLPLVWGENAIRLNHCGQGHKEDADGNHECYCQCHWSNYYVNVYEIDRGYGGPEEGGWWFDIGEPVASIPCDTYAEAEEMRNKLIEKYPHTKSSNSVIYQGGDYSIGIEKEFAKSYPEERPHYE